MVFCQKEDLDEFNYYINEKSHDVYLWLQEKEYSGVSFGKNKFNYNMSLNEIYKTISEYVNIEGR